MFICSQMAESDLKTIIICSVMAPAVETTDDTPLQWEEKTATSVEMIQVDSAGFAVKM